MYNEESDMMKDEQSSGLMRVLSVSLREYFELIPRVHVGRALQYANRIMRVTGWYGVVVVMGILHNLDEVLS
jgi:hypothetical protein